MNVYLEPGDILRFRPLNMSGYSYFFLPAEWMYIWGLADAGSGWVKFLTIVYKFLAIVYKSLAIVSGQNAYTFGARAKNKDFNMLVCSSFTLRYLFQLLYFYP